MRSSIFSIVFTVALGLGPATARPAPTPGQVSQISQLLQSAGLQGLSTTDLTSLLQNLGAQGAGCQNGAGAGAGEGQGEGEAGAGEGEGEAGEGEAENEVELAGQFDVAVAVEGGDLKQDIVYTPSAVGSFEYEYQAATADEITVSENATPAPPPAGFEAIEPSSYIVALAQSKGAGLTLSKIDYIFDTAAAGLAGKDISQAQVGRLCPDTGAFVISESLGELEFELEENEVTLNLNKNVTAEGEWGIFLPVAAAAGGEAAALEGEEAAEGEKAVEGEKL